ncbi:MAG: S9 family peptidase [Actinobacteria bacterium]|nr:S9 family peptidase [Actinomycetota bacterium]
MEGFPRQHARTRRFTCGAPRSVSVADDGSRVLFLRSAAGDDPVNALWRLDPATGEERLVADPGVLLAGAGNDSERERARRERAREVGEGIVAYDGLPDLSRVCFVLAGRVFLADVDEGRVVEFPSTGDAFDPRLSPDGSSVAYVSGRGVRVTGAGGDRRLIGSTTDTVSWGSAEFVAAEEMGRMRGHWWAPDGSCLLVTRVDVAPVAEWWISSPVEPWSAPRAIRYPAAGTANADVALGVVALDGTVVDVDVDVDWGRDGEFEYLADVQWVEGAPPVLVVQARDQRTLAVVEVDVRDGSTVEVYRIEDGSWVELVPGSPCRWDGALVTVEDRDGTRRLVVDGEDVSPDGLQVRRIVGVDGDRIVVCASTGPLDVDVVAVERDGSVEVLSSGGGVRSAAVGGGVLAVSIAGLGGSRLSVGEHLVASFVEEPVVDPNPTFHVVGKRDLQAAVLFPSEHSGNHASPLPVLLDPYGGPHAQRVQRIRGQFLTSQWFADQGFAVVVIDGRGTPGRGPAWERAVRGDLAGPPLADQVDALHALAEVDDRLDLARVAIRGWSFGGYLAALAVLRRPDVFHAAIAGAPVTDWRLYDTHYTERYLGHPDEEPLNYERIDLCAEAASLTRPLLLIHGLADDNVVAAHTLQFSRALLEAGRPHRVLPLSGVTHMTPQEEVAENLLLLQLGFLREALGL